MTRCALDDIKYVEIKFFEFNDTNAQYFSAGKPIRDDEYFDEISKPDVSGPEKIVGSRDYINFDVATMDAKLLQKLEELTLYIIQQQKQIDILQKKMDENHN